MDRASTLTLSRSRMVLHCGLCDGVSTHPLEIARRYCGQCHTPLADVQAVLYRHAEARRAAAAEPAPPAPRWD